MKYEKTVISSFAQAVAIIAERIKNSADRPFIIGIDGECAAGKTYFASLLEKEISCGTVHIDDFYLPSGGKEVIPINDGNIDFDRFLREAKEKMRSGKEFSYRVFDCSEQKMTGERRIKNNGIFAVEGTYSLHPRISDIYSLRVFVSADQSIRKERIRQRGEETAYALESKWIPASERYFAYYGIRENCDIIVYEKGKTI